MTLITEGRAAEFSLDKGGSSQLRQEKMIKSEQIFLLAGSNRMQWHVIQCPSTSSISAKATHEIRSYVTVTFWHTNSKFVVSTGGEGAIKKRKLTFPRPLIAACSSILQSLDKMCYFSMHGHSVPGRGGRWRGWAIFSRLFRSSHLLWSTVSRAVPCWEETQP